jgi:uncharacterized membrane-anchored protein YhcB (DUF1043 family)
MSQYSEANQEQPRDSRKKGAIIYWVIIIILIGACAMLFMKNNQITEESDAVKKHMQSQLDSAKVDRESLQKDFEAASSRIDQLTSQNTKLDSSLAKDKTEMEALQKKIRGILANSKSTADELKKARQMISELTDKTKQYESRIAELERENAVLTDKNVVLTKERDSTVTQNIAIKKIGSVLHTSNMRLEAIHKKKNGSEKATKKAKKVDLLRLKFDIDENHIADAGTKQVYIRIIAPDASILTNPAMGSGMLTTSKGDQLSYSIVKEIALQKEMPVKDVSVDWNQEADYQRGDYTIEIYNGGYKVGSEKVHFK